MQQYVPCPRCGWPEASLVGFTWWGGVLGPKLLTHVKCHRCYLEYNGKTGGSNTTGIVIYTLVGFVIGLIIAAAVFVWMFTRE